MRSASETFDNIRLIEKRNAEPFYKLKGSGRNSTIFPSFL